MKRAVCWAEELTREWKRSWECAKWRGVSRRVFPNARAWPKMSPWRKARVSWERMSEPMKVRGTAPGKEMWS